MNTLLIVIAVLLALFLIVFVTYLLILRGRRTRRETKQDKSMYTEKYEGKVSLGLPTYLPTNEDIIKGNWTPPNELNNCSPQKLLDFVGDGPEMQFVNRLLVSIRNHFFDASVMHATVERDSKGILRYNDPNLGELDELPFVHNTNKVYDSMTQCLNKFVHDKMSYLRLTMRPAVVGRGLFIPDTPTWLDSALHNLTLYCSHSGAVTTFHFDETPGFILQIQGRKQVLLVHKDDSDKMMRYPEKSSMSRRSKMVADLTLPHEIEKWKNINPDLSRIQVREEIIGPGEWLYIPSGFWHLVKSLDEPTVGLIVRL
jgi:hypothetical protein